MRLIRLSLFLVLGLTAAVWAALAQASTPVAETKLPAGVFLPIRVHMAVRVLNVTGLSETTGEASMTVEITERWRNPDLSFDPRQTGFGRVDHVGDEALAKLSAMWTPGTTIENQIGEGRSETTAVSILSDGTVTRIRQLDADFRVTIDMGSFPFDTQGLTLAMISPRHSADEVIYVIDDLDRELSTIVHEVSGANWFGNRLDMVMERFHGWNAKPFVRVKATAILVRNWQYYVLRLFVPFFAVTSVTVFILWAPSDLIGAKAPITYSALLALAALSFTYEGSFPGSISMNSPIAFMISLGYFYLIAVLAIDIALNYASFPGKQRYPHLGPALRGYLGLALPMAFLTLCLAVVFNAQM